METGSGLERDGGGRSHHWRLLTTLPVFDIGDPGLILFHWIGVTIQEVSFQTHSVQTDTSSDVKKDMYIHFRSIVSKSYLISVDVVTSLFILLMLFLF